MSLLAWGNKVSPEFRARIISLCTNLNWGGDHASWLMASIAFETGGTFSPSVKNFAGSGATGLIQFMPKTAIGLGTTVEKLASMTAVGQLTYVEAYFRPYAKRISSLSDMYMAILLPSAIGAPDNAPLFSGGVAYRQNSALDANSDGVVTKQEAANRVQAKLESGMLPENVFNVVKPEEKPVDPIAATILETTLPKLFSALPDLVSIFKKPDVASRNAEVIAKVGDIIMSSVPAASNMQEAVTKIVSDPQTATEVNTAIRLSRADLMDILDRVSDLDQKSVDSARAFNSDEPIMIDTPRLKMKFWHILAFIVTAAFIALVIIVSLKSTNETERVMLFQALVGSYLLIMGFVFGSSTGSKIKDFIKGSQ